MPSLPEILIKYKGQVLDAGAIIAIVNEAMATPDRRIPIDGFTPTAMRGYVFAVERYADCLEELKDLHRLHWMETEKYRHALPLDPDYDGFLRMEWHGDLLLFTIRKFGELVGQTTMKLSTSMHSGTRVANEDSLFLRADHRGNLFLMLSFIKYVTGVLEQVGVKEIRVSSKLVNGADKLMVRAGFDPFALQLVKMVGVTDETQICA